MEMRVNKIELNGLTFQYREVGEASAPAIVALHALGMSAESWDEVAGVLGKEYRFLALDQRGHGGSERTDAYTFELMCDDLLQFVNTMNLERFTLIGHSMGGTVSYLFSETFPERVDRLIVEDTPPPFTGEKFETPSKPPGSLPFDWEVVPSILNQLNNPNPKWWGSLTEIIAPTLIVGGGASHIPQDKLQEVSKRIPNCKLVTVEGAGHEVHAGNLTAFLTAVKSFLDS
ncbi:MULTISPECIES: alpha/beta fold hydrolase [Priestia]|uniref:Alpha/beta hydrolase n=1 Tax=Priestia megaterium TaxID=1404 RepID=A0A3D8X5I5_PRIMG|nr:MULTISPECIES: alpha/beta hydrolase [Priestia]MDH3174522.1 alpha/beta hydrolase [Priestia megaterium]MDR7245139.1 pimeloyl-ACP methyl ester carboxylesterase [Priestia megaterium]QTL51090.1 alpha/beta hydrolase [Priestia aryabhattai]RDZ16221.1 alpha/beta hydrolase [Priestia megaterium]USL44058.1 alpha/beta hydrolase [Priestia megaterium]